jgi:hypothetical protein
MPPPVKMGPGRLPVLPVRTQSVGKLLADTFGENAGYNEDASRIHSIRIKQELERSSLLHRARPRSRPRDTLTRPSAFRDCLPPPSSMATSPICISCEFGISLTWMCHHRDELGIHRRGLATTSVRHWNA